MSNFIYSTSNQILFPLLINVDALDSLDKILSDEWERLTALVDRSSQEDFDRTVSMDSTLSHLMIDENKNNVEIERRKNELRQRLALNAFRYKKEFSLVIDLGNNKRAKFQSFSQAQKDPDMLNETPRGFTIDATAGNIRLNIRLDKDSFSYRISPEHVTESRDTFAALEQWTRSVMPPFWQQLWLKWSFIALILWIFVVAFSATYLTSYPSATAHYREEAYKILEKGVTPDNSLKGMEILLALQTKYQPEGFKDAIPLWWWLGVFLGSLICIGLSIKPKSNIAIGLGVAAIKKWDTYIKIFFRFIPALILLNIIFPFAMKWFFGL